METFAHLRMVLFRLIRATTAPRFDEYAHATHDDSLCLFLICYVWWLTSMVKKGKLRRSRQFTGAFRVNERFLSLLVGSFPFRERPLTLRSLVEGVM